MRLWMAGAVAWSLWLSPLSAQGPLGPASWLAGEWVLIEGSRCTEEHWTSPSANMMVGTSRSVSGGRTTSFEFMRIEVRDDGVYFVAQPGGRPPVDFKLQGTPGPELVFLNPGHADHLTRVVYRRVSADAMAARVEGADSGKAFAVDYAYRRANGAPPPCAS
jgi:hypothetical protein